MGEQGAFCLCGSLIGQPGLGIFGDLKTFFCHHNNFGGFDSVGPAISSYNRKGRDTNLDPHSAGDLKERVYEELQRAFNMYVKFLGLAPFPGNVVIARLGGLFGFP